MKMASRCRVAKTASRCRAAKTVSRYGILRTARKHRTLKKALADSGIVLGCEGFIVLGVGAYTNPHCFLHWAIRENIAQATRPIQRINSSNIALPVRTIMEVKPL